MAATTVTTRGPGISNGEPKPQNHITCSCGPSCGKEPTPPVKKKSYCTTNIKVGTNNSIKVSNGGTSIKVCG